MFESNKTTVADHVYCEARTTSYTHTHLIIHR